MTNPTQPEPVERQEIERLLAKHGFGVSSWYRGEPIITVKGGNLVNDIMSYVLERERAYADNKIVETLVHIMDNTELPADDTAELVTNINDAIKAALLRRMPSEPNRTSR